MLQLRIRKTTAFRPVGCDFSQLLDKFYLFHIFFANFDAKGFSDIMKKTDKH